MTIQGINRRGAQRGHTGKTRRRFTKAEKHDYVSRARDLREHGLAWADVARALGVNGNLLARWRKAADAGVLGDNEYNALQDNATYRRLLALRARTERIMRESRCAGCDRA